MAEACAIGAAWSILMKLKYIQYCSTEGLQTVLLLYYRDSFPSLFDRMKNAEFHTSNLFFYQEGQ